MDLNRSAVKMVRKTFLFIFILSIGIITFADANKRRELVRVVDEELKEVRRLNTQMKGRDPRVMLRMAELYLEKARLIRDAENERFRNISHRERRRTNKANYFKKSRSYFNQAQKTCQAILRRHKRFKEKGDVYYIMAYNAKEFNRHKKAEQYFKAAIRSSRRGSVSHRRSQVALAEIYYNKKKYDRAIKLYERTLSKNDRWWTKDALNLAWSYFRVNRTDKALGLMKEIKRRSLSGGDYIDMSGAVDRDVEYFYTHSGRTKDAIAHLKRKGKNVPEGLVEMARDAERSGKATVAISLLEDALKQAGSNEVLRIKILATLLPIYGQHGHEAKHLKVSKKLVHFAERKKLNEEQREILLHQLKKRSATLQKQVASKTYKHNKKLRETKGQMSITYFTLASRLEKGGSHAFHAGETFYAIGKYDKAIERYLKSLEEAKKRRDGKLVKRILDSMLATLSEKNVSQATKNRYLERVYLDHIKLLPNSKKNKKISERLFNHYMKKKDVPRAEKTLKGYTSLYPGEKKKQEAMVAKIMDHYRKTGDRKQFFAWIGKIQNREYIVSKKYIDQLKKIYLSMEFEKVDQANAKGDKKKALNGYFAIYKSKNSSKEAKKNSAYNIAVLFRDLGHSDLIYKWTRNALKLMNANDVHKYSGTFKSLANDLFNQQDIRKAAQINEITLQKLCKHKAAKKGPFFSNAATLYLAEEDFDSVNRVLSSGKQCGVQGSLIGGQRLALLKAHADKGNWSQFEREVTEASRSKTNYPLLIEFLDRYRSALLANGRIEVAQGVRQRIVNYYKESKKNKYPVPIEGLDVMAKFELKNLDAFKQRLDGIVLQFPEKAYNTALQRKLKEVGTLEEKALTIMKTGSGVGIVRASRVVETAYRGIASEVASFTPPGKSKQYVTGFKKSMRELSNSLTIKANTVRNTAKEAILRDKILSQDNSWFLSTKSLTPFPLNHFPAQRGIVMDRGGRM